MELSKNQTVGKFIDGELNNLMQTSFATNGPSWRIYFSIFFNNDDLPKRYKQQYFHKPKHDTGAIEDFLYKPPMLHGYCANILT